ncbi:MAG TPA: arginase family protein [Aliidongia sp.]|uniref:arginase family protein n=1 Tax=Aliidongia sp. TaxID=1914230 RepID=UPI002DDCA4DB|nr:arginase family protein [Aliidongia sp.]HEV2678427.1 arginase family protein [Aliidongia sp.]
MSFLKPPSRRTVLAGSVASFGLMALSDAAAAIAPPGISLIEAPSNLGLSPTGPGPEPGCWQAPAAFRQAGFQGSLRPAETIVLDRPAYRAEAQAGTRLRNGLTIRTYSERLAASVANALGAGRFPVVLGGDCSILLGCLLGARRAGRLGLVHIDGHSDYANPSNYDTTQRLGAAAGMDLALATGKGEATLTRWDGVAGPLVEPLDAVQLGERNVDGTGHPYPDFPAAGIAQWTVQDIARIGVVPSAGAALQHLAGRGIDRFWIHLDLDVLAESVLPAVDSPGEPGLALDALEEMLVPILGDPGALGIDVTIYDPARDPDWRHAPALSRMLLSSLRHAGRVMEPESPPA